MSEMTDNKSYRQGVSVIIIDKDCKFLIVQKNIYKEDEWTFIGGGREGGETLQENVFREVEEETGMCRDELEFVRESKHRIKYDYPLELAKKVHGGKYLGQSYDQVLVKFNGDKSKLRFNDEIRIHRWVKVDELKRYLVFPNQYANVRLAIQDLMPGLLKD